MHWYYTVNEVDSGPFEEQAIRQAISSGQINGDTLVRNEEMKDWAPARDVQDLADIFRLPPVLPSAAISPTLSGTKTDQGAAAIDMEHEQIINVRLLLENSANRQLAGPWTRFFARLLDMIVMIIPASIITIIMHAIIIIALPVTINNIIQNATYILIVPNILISSALTITVFGNSIGKAIFAIKAVPIQSDQRTLSFKDHLYREVRVWRFGLAFFFPLIDFYTMLKNFYRVVKWLPADYDVGQFTVLSYSQNRYRRAAAIAFTVIIYGGLNTLMIFL
ncbi:RDD family protein [Aureimonas fodinaquatilis]|uniref:RDD family protein n=1 Tax=Aureimonas fodinaquatilis TaxID=2565783 RepID=A0A5B0DWB0_9HYPH|nr:RDD family protein [Aureimonas fodinaquatilis]KAA0971117.1 RDD family protein [Aureimonas fodinaquatilis]